MENLFNLKIFSLNDRVHYSLIKKYSYRPFDERFIYYDIKLIERGREKLMKHFINGENIALDICRQLVSENYSHIFITNKIVDDSFVSNKSRERGYVFPLYLYPENNAQQTLGERTERRANLNGEILEKIGEGIGLRFVEEKEGTDGTFVTHGTEGKVDGSTLPKSETLVKSGSSGTFAPIDVLDYIYGVLHSHGYREK